MEEQETEKGMEAPIKKEMDEHEANLIIGEYIGLKLLGWETTEGNIVVSKEGYTSPNLPPTIMHIERFTRSLDSLLPAILLLGKYHPEVCMSGILELAAVTYTEKETKLCMGMVVANLIKGLKDATP